MGTVSDGPRMDFIGGNSDEWPKGEAPERWKVDRKVGIKGEIHPITAIEEMVHWLLFTQAAGGFPTLRETADSAALRRRCLKPNRRVSQSDLRVTGRLRNKFWMQIGGFACRVRMNRLLGQKVCIPCDVRTPIGCDLARGFLLCGFVGRCDGPCSKPSCH